MASILVIEDEDNLRFSIRQSLSKGGHDVAEALSVDAAWEATRQRDFDLALCDINLGTQNGLDLVARLREDGFEGAVIVMTAYGSVGSAVQAMKNGADDYLQKPLSLEELGLIVTRALEHRKARNQLKLMKRMERMQGAGVAAGDGIIGTSPAWKGVLSLADRLARVPVAKVGEGKSIGSALPTVLILGETGTGKGVLARYIHERSIAGESGASEAPFVHVNCSALPPSLVESELFGHEKGAFTDAKGQRSGLFELAEGGTIFLDEIGDMPLELQAKILTVVEDGTYRRVGGSRERRVRARLIAATNQDLEKRARDGTFRGDLLYRLNAFTLRLPALRERSEDAVLLAERMLERFAREFGRGSMRLSEGAKQAIRAHDWPGNVRELINITQRAAMLSEEAEVMPGDLGIGAGAGARIESPRMPATTQAASIPATHHNGNGNAKGLVFDFDHGTHTADDVERELILQALKKTGGNVSKAARLIGMQRSSFRYRLDRFRAQGIEAKVVSDPSEPGEDEGGTP